MAMSPLVDNSAEPVVDEATALSAAACLFRSLGDPTRLAILRPEQAMPLRGPVAATEIS